MPNRHTTEQAVIRRRVRAWWVDALLLGVATLLAELALHEAVVLTPAPIPMNIRGLIDAVGLVLIVSPLFAWTLYRRSVDAKYERVKTEQLKVPGSPHQRVRVAVLGSLTVFAVLVAVALWGNVAVSRTLSRQGQVIDALSQLRLHGERIARFAATAHEHSIDNALLSDELTQLELAVTRIDTLVGIREHAALPNAALIDSVIARMRAQQASLLAVAARREMGGKLIDVRIAREIHEHADAYQMLAGRALAAVQRAQNADIANSQSAAMSSGLMAFAVLLGIALLVVEPVVRLLRRQHTAITGKSLE
ncbi:hypothetical protein, partial [Gemmatimonas sp.]|uniref:hypothetical protein n=1 Tax=Gemmatimonas sp. TaxID=1962908 RepID=UPI003340E9F6